MKPNRLTQANAELISRAKFEVLLQFAQDLRELKPCLQPADKRKDYQDSRDDIQENDRMKKIRRRVCGIVAQVVRKTEHTEKRDAARCAEKHERPQNLNDEGCSAAKLEPTSGVILSYSPDHVRFEPLTGRQPPE